MKNSIHAWNDINPWISLVPLCLKYDGMMWNYLLNQKPRLSATKKC